MILLLSGEGATDLGRSTLGNVCRGHNFAPGAMAQIVDKILSPQISYSVLDKGKAKWLCFVPEGQLKYLEKTEPRSLRFRGLKKGHGTGFHFSNAERLGRYAQQLEKAEEEKVIVVFFRDSDKEADGTWEEKMASMAKGFEAAAFERGVPMMPKPKSEAWLLCAFRNGYRNCAVLEQAPQTDRSANSLKVQLENHWGRYLPPEEVTKKVAGDINVEKLDMPSFRAFKTRLEEVAKLL